MSRAWRYTASTFSMSLVAFCTDEAGQSAFLHTQLYLSTNLDHIIFSNCFLALIVFLCWRAIKPSSNQSIVATSTVLCSLLLCFQINSMAAEQARRNPREVERTISAPGGCPRISRWSFEAWTCHCPERWISNGMGRSVDEISRRA